MDLIKFRWNDNKMEQIKMKQTNLSKPPYFLPILKHIWTCNSGEKSNSHKDGGTAIQVYMHFILSQSTLEIL